MATLSEIKKPIADEMAIFEHKFKAAMASNIPLLDRVTHYIVKRKGKQLRPMLVFLSAKMHSDITEATYRAASLVELMHTATLVHDDVVDDSNQRRGFFSINAIWKNKIAVLVGDFLLSKLLLLATEHKEYQLLEIVSTAVKEMSEGELLQIEKARRLDVDEAIYFDIIRQKTASLIAACCAAGAASSGATDAVVDNMRNFGNYLGIAFQIKDDLFDYQRTNKAGKPSGIDIKEQKMTLPLIYTLQNASWSDKRYIINTVKNHNTNTKRVNKVIEMVYQSGGIAYATDQMLHYKALAVACLNEYPKSDALTALRAIVDYVIDREK
ncbi:MAG: polyprenyl synthetase family protein [Schleiferiaceae bacterium]|nr:polyprenyl synthetase family protein [Schleiferiaceae bacterium]